MRFEKPVLFFSDLHLGASKRSEERLKALLARLPPETILFSLGDTVDFWVEGSDYDLAESNPILKEFRRFESYFLEGNRDFLIGERWSAATGGTVIRDDSVAAETFGESIVCTHGDLLVAGDWRYQIWRRFARSRLFRSFASACGRSSAEKFAAGLRRGSEAEVARKSLAAMNISSQSASTILDSFSTAKILLAGHTHRPEARQLPNGRLIVLGAWDQNAEIYYLSKDRKYHGSVDGLSF